MDETRVILSGLWVATMLTYLWGDVIRILASEGKIEEIFNTPPTQGMWFFMAGLMMIPILMVVLSLMLPYPAIRWTNIILAGFWILFNLFSLSGYPIYNKFLLIVSMVFNGLIVWYAWKWVS